MRHFFQSLGITDLISEMHKQLRADIMHQAHEVLPKQLSEMELYLLHLIKHQSISISEAARVMGITRQGAHKSTKHLLELGYVESQQVASNKREKYLTLTPQGWEVDAYIESLKEKQTQQLVSILGEEQVKALREGLLTARENLHIHKEGA